MGYVVVGGAPAGGCNSVSACCCGGSGICREVDACYHCVGISIVEGTARCGCEIRIARSIYLALIIGRSCEGRCLGAGQGAVHMGYVVVRGCPARGCNSVSACCCCASGICREADACYHCVGISIVEGTAPCGCGSRIARS